MYFPLKIDWKVAFFMQIERSKWSSTLRIYKAWLKFYVNLRKQVPQLCIVLIWENFYETSISWSLWINIDVINDNLYSMTILKNRRLEMNCFVLRLMVSFLVSTLINDWLYCNYYLKIKHFREFSWTFRLASV